MPDANPESKANAVSIILVDVSASMAEPVGDRRRCDVLDEILRQVLPASQDARVFAFSELVQEIERGARVPVPGGGTALHTALTYIAPFQPMQVVVLSDGEPNDAEAALAVARTLSCNFVTYFCGDERNHTAVAFLRALAWTSSNGIGHAAVIDLHYPDKLVAELRLQLTTGPAA
jgi:hypothetical protein